MIRKKWVTIGHSWGVIIPKAILEGLGINPVLDDVGIEIETDGIKLKKLKRED